jgi:moderate conductance mechanosensitive channel
MESFFDEKAGALVQTGVVLVAVLILWMLALRVANRTMDRMDLRGPDTGARARTLWSMARRLLIVVFLVTAVLMVAGIWSLPLTPLVAVGSAVGVAVGFGAQSLVKDVISGFFILAEDQYHIGDVVKLADVVGSVIDIRPRVTVLRDLDGNVHYIPNGQITVASNYTQEFAQVVLDVGIAYKESVDRVIEVIEDELTALSQAEEWSDLILEEPLMMGVDDLGDSAVTIRAVIKVAAESRWKVKREALRRIKNRLDSEGIEIPYPHMTVYRGGDDS